MRRLDGGESPLDLPTVARAVRVFSRAAKARRSRSPGARVCHCGEPQVGVSGFFKETRLFRHVPMLWVDYVTYVGFPVRGALRKQTNAE